jgi:enoyl-CoA hydratase
MIPDLLSISREGAVMHWVLQRQEAHNAVNFDVMSSMESALDALEQEAEVRVLLFTASGESFISGGDLRAFSGLHSAEDGRAMANRMKSILDRIESLPCITICLINGDAYGGGCETALAFDQIWLHETAKMGFTQANFALSPGWGGYTRLIERVGSTTALQWLAERARVDAHKALRRGLIDRVIPTPCYKETVDEHLSIITHTDAGVIKTLKAIKKKALLLNRNELMAYESDLFEQLWASDSHHERVERFLNRSRG